MTEKELRVFFKEHLVPSRLYKINGNHNNRICMDKDKNGWYVYFSDRKQKVGMIRYSSEADACAGMKDEVRKLMQCLYGISWTA